MRNRLTRSLHLPAVTVVAATLGVAIPLGCSLRPTDNSTATSGGGSGATVGVAGVGGAPSATAGVVGAGAGQTSAPSTGTNPIAAVTNGAGGSVMQDDPTCTAFTPTRAAVLTPVDPKVATLLQGMSITDKINLLSGGPVANPNYTEDFAATGDQALGIPDYQLRDGPRGVHLRQGDSAPASTTWAVAEARAASFDQDLEYRVGQAQGEEMSAFKYELSLAPVVNVLRNPLWGRAQETYGEDPVLVGEMGAAFVAGMQTGGPKGRSGACPKHYTGNDTENNRNATTSTIDEQTLRENYTRPFEIIVKKADPACIMAAYNGVNTGQTCTVNTHLLTDILRTDWKWTGLVVSDWWATKGTGDVNINAGLDLEMSDNAAFKSLPGDVTSGKVMGSRVDEAATRILNVREKMGGLDSAYISKAANPGIVNDAGHIALAQETAEKGAVLLKNDGLLPLGPNGTTTGTGKDGIKSIIILGPDANVPTVANLTNTTSTTADVATGLGDQGSSFTVPPHAVSYLAGLQKRATGITVTTSANAADASKADIAIIPVSMSHSDEGEGYNGGGDRSSMTLTTTHPKHWSGTKPTAFIKAAAAANPNVIVLLTVGSAIVMEDWMANAKAIVQTFYPGQEGGTAVARLLFGDINFTAKLPFTVAQAEADYPAFQNTGTTETFDYFHGYRKIEHDKKTPRFWFGYGMSYTTYEYSDLKVLCTNGISTTGRLNAEVTVKNTGKMQGDEIVQLYIGYPNTKAKRPVKELKSFTRVTLMPGESKTVSFQVPAGDMAYWDTTSNGWVVEKVGHTVLVGPSADPKTLLSQPFTIE